MWQMRVVIHRDAIRIGRDHLLQRAGHAGSGLLGQTIDQINADRAELGGTRGVDDGDCCCFRLDAVDCFLQGRIKILHAQTGTVDAPSGIGANLIGIEMARVDLQRNFGTFDEIKGLVQSRHDLVELTACQAVGRATAKVQMRDLWPPCQVAFDQPDFFQQVFEKQLDGPLAFDDMGVATAIPAQLVAEGHMHIE